MVHVEGKIRTPPPSPLFLYHNTMLKRTTTKEMKLHPNRIVSWTLNCIYLRLVVLLLLLLPQRHYHVYGAAPLLEDNVLIRDDVIGRSDVQEFGWADSYSDGNSCYCASSFDHDIGDVIGIRE